MSRRPNLAQPDDVVTVAIPRSALTVIEQARMVSQRSCEHVLGIPRPAYLQIARDYAAAGGEVMAIGRLRVCEIDPLLAWLRRRETSIPRAANDASEPSEREKLEAELGLVGAR